MDQPPGWIKQSNAIPRHVAHKALRALVARLSAFDLPAVTSTQIHALTRPNEDTEGDAVAPGAWYLRHGDRALLHSLSPRPLHPSVHAWPFIFASTEKSSFTPVAGDRAWTIIALQTVSYSNGLPALGVGEERTQLNPGDALHFLGDVAQTYGGGGGGLCTMIEWSYFKEGSRHGGANEVGNS